MERSIVSELCHSTGNISRVEGPGSIQQTDSNLPKNNKLIAQPYDELYLIIFYNLGITRYFTITQ
jgi:hypothetical protein